MNHIISSLESKKIGIREYITYVIGKLHRSYIFIDNYTFKYAKTNPRTLFLRYLILINEK